MKKLIANTIQLVDKKQKKKSIFLFVSVLIMGLIEVIGVGSIIPFLAVVANPGSVEENPFLLWARNILGVHDTDAFLFILGLCCLGLFLLTNFIRIFNVWYIARYVWDNQSLLAIRLMRAILNQPYSYFLDKNSSDLGKNVLNETQQYTQGALLPLVTIFSYSFVTLLIGTFIVWYDPEIAALAFSVIGIGYGAYIVGFQRKLKDDGEKRLGSTASRFKIVQEAFGSIKTTKVLSKETAFVDQFALPSIEFAKALSAMNVIRGVPRYLFECLAFGSVILIVLFLLESRAGLDHVLPVVGLYAFAGYRLLPAVNQVFSGYSQLRFNTPVVNTLSDDLRLYEETLNKLRDRGLVGGHQFVRSGCRDSQVDGISISNVLEMNDVSFRYSKNSGYALKEIDLVIKKGQFIGIVGLTGSGKTTLVDVILGLLEPESGIVRRKLYDDSEDLTSNSLSGGVGYVPQDVFLTDDTIEANVALGVPVGERDIDAIGRALRMANIEEFVVNLDHGYQTVVGDRGVRLSGGERQRIGIARALYNNPELVVLDEATSNLDQTTEKSVFEAIKETVKKKTVIMIAHRLKIVKECDQIYFLEQGRIVGEGTYAELITKSEKFREMVNA